GRRHRHRGARARPAARGRAGRRAGVRQPPGRDGHGRRRGATAARPGRRRGAGSREDRAGRSMSAPETDRDPTVPALSAEPGRAGVLRALWPHARPLRHRIAAAVATSLLATGALVAVPPVIGLATDAATAGDRTGLLVAAGLVVALAVVRMLAFRAAELMLATTGEQLVRALRDLV